MVHKLRAIPALIGISQPPTVQKRTLVRFEKNFPQATPYIEQRLSQVKSAMGKKLICHPDYVPNPRHSHNPEIYRPARAHYLAAVAEVAQRDRERNPAYQLAQRIRAITGEQA